MLTHIQFAYLFIGIKFLTATEVSGKKSIENSQTEAQINQINDNKTYLIWSIDRWIIYTHKYIELESTLVLMQ